MSIIVPCFNKAEFLAETLDSVLNQDFREWECIIVDDGSIDNTAEIAKAYYEKDTRFKYVFQENQGVSTARNNGIRFSSGTYILPLDADDLLSKDYASKAVSYLDGHPECKLVYPIVELFGTHTGIWDLPEYSFNKEIWENLIVCSAVFRRKDYDKTSGYNDNMKGGFEDWDFWLTFLSNTDIVKRLDIVGLYYRQLHSSRNIEAGNKSEELKKQIVNNHRDIYEPYFESIITFRDVEVRALEELEKIKGSVSYKLGESLAKPYRWLRYRQGKTV